MRYLLLALLCFLLPLLSGCKDQSLLTNLDQRQATEIQAVLQKHQITSTRKALGKGLFDISVKKEDMGIAIQILEEYQLPTLSRIEVTQLFPSDALVSSPQAEKARLISAIEQRLEQSLLTIDHIIDARVHVSYPISPTERIIPTPHASALVFYEEGMLDNDQLGEDVKAFIHNSFNDMDENNITVLLYPRNINKFNIIKVCTVCLVGMSAVSCNNSFMDRFPIAEISPENSFKTAKDLELYTNSFYENLPKINDIVRADNISDNVLYSNVPMEQRSDERDIPSEAGSSNWNWGILRKINIFFDNYTRCEDKIAALKYEGVARFFRAWFYFDKVKRFGGVPWYETEIKTDNEELLYKPKDSREFIVDKIVEDLEIAVDRLGITRKPDQVSKWTALAFLSRVCLYEGTYRKYHTELNLPDADKFLEKAYKAAERVMSESGYKLYTTGSPSVDYRDLFALELKDDEVILGGRYSLSLNKMHNTNYYFLSKTSRM